MSAGEQARVTVAAVDVGILNLTRYLAPDPVEYFFGQRQLSTEIRDLYGYLIDGMQGTRGAIRSGGDMGGAIEGSPPTQEPLARYSGIVEVAPDGTAEVEFDIPSFNGTARVMAVAWTADRVGHASADVIVRDPVVVSGTLPRFLSVGDQSRFFMQIDNVEGPAGDYTIDLDINGPIVVAADALRSRVRLEANGRATVTVPIAAAGRRHGDRRRDGHRSGLRGGPALLAARSARELVAGAPRRPSLAERREPDRLRRISWPTSCPAPARSPSPCRRSPRSTCRAFSRRSTAILTAAPSRS